MPIDATPLPDPTARRRLLEALASRGSSEAGALIIPGFLAWACSRVGDATPLVVWWVVFGALAAVSFTLRRRFRADVARTGDEAARRWEPVFGWMALTNGLCWTVPLFATMPLDSHEFKLLLYVVMAAVMASAATYLAPVWGVFTRFMAGCYGPMVVATCWVFPDRWPIMLPLVLLYGAVLFRHAWGSRQFMLQHMVLERERTALAEQYRVARDCAEHALAEKTRFLSTASHDLRQPVHAMGMLVEAALARNSDIALQPVLLDVHRCTRSLTAMFDALLDLSRIEAGTFSPTVGTLAVRDLFGDAATVFGRDADERGLTLRFHLPRRCEAMLAGDPTLLRQVLFNLLQNALRYTARGGVLVGARARGSQWRLEVWDTGAGVAREDRSRIYSPFYRSALPHARQSTGHGLGLAVVARSVELMGAGCGFESTPGRGSCFWVEVPAAPHGSPPVAVERAARRLRSLSGRCLLVDDDPAVGAAWAELLRTWGVTARWARDGAEANACVDGGFAPDAILCDHRLAGGETGFTVLKALLERCPDARGAMVSGEFDTPVLREAEDDGYLVFRKPVEPGTLHAVLSGWLAPAIA